MLLGWCVTLTHADLSIKKKIKLENWSSRKVAYRKKNHKRFGYSPSWKWRRCVLYNYRSVKMAFSFSFTAHNYTVLTPLTIRYNIYSTYKTIKNETWLYYSITYTGCFFFLAASDSPKQVWTVYLSYWEQQVVSTLHNATAQDRLAWCPHQGILAEVKP